jgi:hypothetical protein
VIRRAALPAIRLEQVGRGREHVRHATSQVDMAVAVIVDAVVDVGRRQELGLAELTGIDTDQLRQGEIAALHDLQRGDELALEQLGAAAVVRQRRNGAHHRQLAHVARAKIALQAPDRDAPKLAGYAALL